MTSSPHPPVLTTLIVGSNFKPHARALLRALPSGTPLGLDPEPDNLHDSNAVAVWYNFWLDSASNRLPTNLRQVLETNAPNAHKLQLGYIPRPGNQDLLRQPDASSLCDNLTISSALTQPDWHAELCFGPNGDPRVRLISD